MEVFREAVLLAISASLALLVLVVGLDARPRDLVSVLRSPRSLIAAILAVNVAAPAAALLLVTFIPLAPPVRAGILLMAISPAPPLVPGKLVKLSGDKSYAYGLYAALILLAAVTVPVSAAIVAGLLGADLSIPSLAVVRNVAVTAVAPLVVGVGLRALAPSLAARAVPFVYKGAMILLVVAAVPLLVRAVPAIAGLAGDGGFLVMALTVAIASIVGAVLAGPEPEQRAALAAAAASRHPGIALVIAKANTDDPQVAATVLGFLLIGLVVAIPVQAVMKRWAGARPAPSA